VNSMVVAKKKTPKFKVEVKASLILHIQFAFLHSVGVRQ
jgi:hypothetical protein